MGAAMTNDPTRPTRPHSNGTKVLLSAHAGQIKFFAVPARPKCEELDRSVRAACAAISEARRTRRNKDVSIHEDVLLSREEHEKLYLVIKHLLVGHEGEPCPAGERPIISVMKPLRRPAKMLRARAAAAGGGSGAEGRESA
jgi:hypothetical protein